MNWPTNHGITYNPGVVTLIFSHMRRPWPFGGFKILNFVFWGVGWVFKRKLIFFGAEDFMDNLVGHHKNWTDFPSHFCHLRVFS